MADEIIHVDGKSTISQNLATAWANEGRRVALVDSEPLNSVAKWHASRRAREDYAGTVPEITLVETHGNIHHALKQLDTEHDFVVADTAGKDSRDMRTGLLAAHVVVFPFATTQKDLESVDNLI